MKVTCYMILRNMLFSTIFHVFWPKTFRRQYKKGLGEHALYEFSESL